MKKIMFILLLLVVLLSACEQARVPEGLYMYRVAHDGKTHKVCANGVSGVADVYIKFYLVNSNNEPEVVAGFPAPVYFTSKPVSSCE